MMKITKLCLALSLCSFTISANANLLISEVLYDAPNNDSTEEYVELFNAGCNTIDLSQYHLNDNGSSVTLNGNLESGQYFTIAANQSGFNGLFDTSPNQTPLVLTLGNSGDFVKLLKGTEEVDIVGWEGGLSGWSLNARNVAIQRTTILNTKSQADWVKASNPGTPGRGSLSADSSCSGIPNPQPSNRLGNGQVKSNLAADANETLKFIADIPANSKDLSFKMSGGTGDADLYVRFDKEPTSELYDCAPYLTGNDESCPIQAPREGRYYINISAYSNFSGVSLVANYTVDGGTPNPNPNPTPEPNPDGYAYDTYYGNAIGKSGNALKSSLNQIIKGHTRFSYSQVWDRLGYADEDPNNTNNVILLYTGRSEPKTNRAGMSNSQDAWNREHVWAKSHGFPSSGQHGYTDLHHLRPADVSVNSTRGNKDFAEGGSAISEAPGNYSDSDSFEPMASVKGDVARMIFYMDVRYEGSDSSGTPDLSIANGSTGTGEALLGDLCTLLSWHIQDPVSDWERRRNNRIYEWQKNRNPFIDNPLWANELYSASCN